MCLCIPSRKFSVDNPESQKCLVLVYKRWMPGEGWAHFYPLLHCTLYVLLIIDYSRFQIFRHDIAKKYRINWLMRRIRPRKFNVRLFSTELIPTRFIFTKEAYRGAPFSLQGTTFVFFNYIVPKYLKPTIYVTGKTEFGWPNLSRH